MVVTLLSPKQYKSKAKLFVRLGPENTLLDSTATIGQGPVVSTPLSREAEIKSISEMIINRSLYEEVVDEVGPELILKKKIQTEDGTNEDVEPGMIDHLMAALIQVGIVNDLPMREKAIIKMQKNIAVEAVEKSNVVVIEYESHDPELSQKVVDSVTRKYLERHVQLHRSQGAYTFLNEQTERLKKELEANEQRIEDLKKESGVIDTDAYRLVLVNRLAKISDEKIEVDAQYEAMTKEVERLEELKSQTKKDVITEETIGVGNEGVDGMRQDLYRLELQREDLLARFDRSHNRVKAIEQQIASAKKIMEKAEADRKESRRGPNQVYQKIEIELNAKIPQLYSLEAKSKAYAEQIRSIEKEQTEFAELETTFGRLKRQINLDDAKYQNYANNREQANIDAKLGEDNLSNISIADSASLELKPSKPNKLMNLALGLVFGAFIGFGFAVYREYKAVITSRTSLVERETDLPVVGSMESVPPRLRIEEELVVANE